MILAKKENDFSKELKTINQKWTRIQGGPCLWLRKWERKPFYDSIVERNKNIKRIIPFSVENSLIAISSGGGLIATYSISKNISKYLNIYSPDLYFMHEILLKIQKPALNNIEWYEFCEVSYIAFTPDELIVVLLNNFTLLIFNNIGALVNFSIYKNVDNSMNNLSKPSRARLVSYSLAILSTDQKLVYIPDVRKPLWFTSFISEFNISLSQNFDFIPLNDFSYPFLYYITKDFTINANIGTKSKNIKIPNHQVLGISVSPDLSNVACLMINTKAEILFYVLFTDRQFTQSKMNRILISNESLDGYPNAENIVTELPNFLNFCWCGKTSILINYNKYCIFVDMSGGISIIENSALNLVIYPEIDGARIICQSYDQISNSIITNNDKNQKKSQKLFFQSGHNFLSIVPEWLESVFKKKNMEYYQNYIEWSHGLLKEENVSRFDKETLKEKIDSFIEASKMITEKNIQQILLGTSWFFQSYLDPLKRIPTEKDKRITKTFEKIRILHLLREDSNENNSNSENPNDLELKEKAFKGMLITYEQMEFLTFPTIINRLCNRGAHVTALIISKIVEIEKNPIFNHKALMLIYSNIRYSINEQQRRAIINYNKKSKKKFNNDNSAERFVNELSKSFDNLDYSQLAMAALKFGDDKICKELLKKEKDSKKKIPVFLLLGDIQTAFEFAVDYKDQKLINYVAQYAIDHDRVDVVTSLYNKALLPFARFDNYDNQQISLLIFMIRSMKANALLSYLFSIMKKKLLPPDVISFEILKCLESKNILHYRDSYTKYINMLKWILDRGDDQLRSIISSGISTNVRPIVKAQLDLINRINTFYEEQSVTSYTDETKSVEKSDDIKVQIIQNNQEMESIQPQNQEQNQEQKSDSESKQVSLPKNDQDLETESKSESETQSYSRSKSKKEAKSKSKKKSKQKNDTDTDIDSDYNAVADTDADSDTERSKQKGKKKKDQEKKKKNDKKKEKEKGKKKSTSKKKNSKKDNKESNDDDDNEKETKKTDNDKKSDDTNKNDLNKKVDETSKSDEKDNKKVDEIKKPNDDVKENDKSDDNKKNDEIKPDENEDETKKKKIALPTIKLPFLFRNLQKSQEEKEEENKEEIIEEEEEEIEKEEEQNKENKEEQKTEEIDQLQFNYFPKLRNNVSAMKAIEFELCNGRIDDAKKIASLINLPEQRFIWLLINFYLRTNAQDNDLLQLCDKIGMIDGLWVVRRCIVLNRLNIAAAFLENISNYKDKYQARIELQRVITSRQNQASKVDVKDVLQSG